MVDAKVWYAKYDASAKYYGLFNKKIGIRKIQWLGSGEYSQNLRCWGENTTPYPEEANFTIVGTALVTHILRACWRRLSRSNYIRLFFFFEKKSFSIIWQQLYQGFWVLFSSEATHINENNKTICLFYIVLCGTVRDRCKCVKLSFSTLFLRKKGNKDRKNMFKWFNPLFLPQLCVNQNREVRIYSFPWSETSIF